MNTKPYLKIVTIGVAAGDNHTDLITDCEPFVPGNRSVFALDWHFSRFDGAKVY